MLNPRITEAQMRSAALEVLAGAVVKPLGTEFCGLEFDTFDGLRAGTRLRLEQLGQIPPLVPKMPFWPSSAFDPEDEPTFRKICDEFIEERIIIPDNAPGWGGQGFTTAVLSPHFNRRWQFTGLLSGGGQSKTYRVRDKVTGSLGVLKLPKTLDDAAKKRFRREVKILEQNYHPSVIPMLDCCLDDSELGIVTPYGMPLEEHWATLSATLSPAEVYDAAFSIVRQLAEGIAALHRKKVYHRDLKTANIVMINGEPKIIDFGVVNTAEFELEDLTAQDGRHVENGPIPYYWKDAERDVVGLAWIYGLLIERPGIPKHRHCQWQAHEIVDEPRATRARALLAACSVRNRIPADAAAFMKLMDQQMLGPEESRVGRSAGSDEDGAAAAELAHAERSARAALNEAEEVERTEAAIQILDFPLTQLRSKLIECCIGTARLPVKQFDGTKLPHLPFATEGVPMKDLLRRAYECHADESAERLIAFFSCRCEAVRPFHVSALIAFTPHYVEDALQFRLCLWCHDGGAPEPNLSMLYATLPDGGFRNEDSGRNESVEEIAAHVRRWILAEPHWSYGLPPRSERRQNGAYERDLEVAQLLAGPRGY